MDAVYGYSVKSTWLKVICAGNDLGWPLLSIENIFPHYPETGETPKLHLNQPPKNVCSTKPKAVETSIKMASSILNYDNSRKC